jgi:hypothetical protein
MNVRLENGQEKALNTDTFRHIDHAYAVTSHKSQGETSKDTFEHHNTESGRHGDRETGVNLTRARESTTIYTQDIEKAAEQSGLKLDKETALPESAQPAAEAETGAGIERHELDRLQTIGGEAESGNVENAQSSAQADANNNLDQQEQEGQGQEYIAETDVHSEQEQYAYAEAEHLDGSNEMPELPQEQEQEDAQLNEAEAEYLADGNNSNEMPDETQGLDEQVESETLEFGHDESSDLDALNENLDVDSVSDVHDAHDIAAQDIEAADEGLDDEISDHNEKSGDLERD